MVTRKDYDALAAAGGLAKPTGRRKPDEGREQHNSTLRAFVPMKRVNEERRAELRERQFGPQAQACRDIRVCGHCGEKGITVPHHHHSCGSGGEDRDTLPLLPTCHSRLHTIGPVRFWMEAGVDPDDVLDCMREWVAAGCPQGAMPFGGRK